MLLEIERMGNGRRPCSFAFIRPVDRKRSQRDSANFEQCCRFPADRERGDYVSVAVELPRG